MYNAMYACVMAKKRKAKMGRPPIPASELRSVLVAVRMTRAERARIRAEARRQGVTVTDLLMRGWREEKK